MHIGRLSRTRGEDGPVGGEVGRGIDHPLRKHDLAREPPARVGAAEPGGGRRRRDASDGELVLVLVILLHMLVVLLLLLVATGGCGRGLGGEEGSGEGTGARLGVGAPGGLRLEGKLPAALLVGDGRSLVRSAWLRRRRHGP